MPQEDKKAHMETSKQPRIGPGAWMPSGTETRKGQHYGGRKGNNAE